MMRTGRRLWLVLGLVFFDGAVVIDEDEGVLVIGILVASSTRVARAEVALRVVSERDRLHHVLGPHFWVIDRKGRL